ncbi:non-ribosomal peptide synthetase [Paenibacillus harenae]|uniref:non-ribosomal peptide synthetase n=1 Tax=Paenibacillus harenae TaxID=306543 RepID=UPI00278F3C4D|nr:non-ribosomal peptide synthetase [Paenibacillus harenae]MDQ0059025.1 amino acid adenylation domain-containing protein [Paenibacillus harenae]
MKLSKAEIFQRVEKGEIGVSEAYGLINQLANPDLHEARQFRQPVSFPLSEAQTAVWTACRLSPDNYAYNIPLSFRVRDGIDPEVFKRAYSRLVDRHPSMRITMNVQGQEPMQTVHPDMPLTLIVQDMEVASEEQLKDKLLAEAHLPFDLEKGPLSRAMIGKQQDGSAVLLLVFHHLITDGMSSVLFLQELIQTYSGELTGQPVRLAPLEATYRDFVEWERGMLADQGAKKNREYWLHYLEGDITPLELAIQKTQSGGNGFQGASLEQELDPRLIEQLRALAIDTRTSLSSIMMAVYFVLLNRYSGQEDIILGIPFLGRPEPRFQNVIGYFSNVIPVRAQVGQKQSFRHLLEQVSASLLESFEHSSYPFFTLLKDLGTKGSGLLQASFHYQNMAKNFFEMADAKQNEQSRAPFEAIPGIHQTGEFNLTLELHDSDDGIKLFVKYNPSLFEIDAVKRMSTHFVSLLGEAAASPDRPLTEFVMLSDNERKRIIRDWNDTDAEYPSDQCFYALFDDLARQMPDRIAATYGNSQITYAELRLASSRFAAYLHELGVVHGTYVGIFMERSLDLLTALLGVQKAGAIYIPMDPSFPSDRLSYMLDISEAKVLITEASIADQAPKSSATVIRFDNEFAAFTRAMNVQHGPDYMPLVDGGAMPEDLAYILFTSGSTGKPKGVQISHRAMVNFLCSMAKQPGFEADDHLAAITTISFDISVLELYLPLLVGGRTEIIPSAIAKDGILLKAALEQSAATVFQATPATLQMLLSVQWTKNERLKKILVGGEALSSQLAQALLKQEVELWNMFGPTETTVWSTVCRIQEGDRITVGQPIANTECYILDDQMRPVPAGIEGELYIGGDGVAQGYLKRDDENAAKFLPNPFRPGSGARIYRTSDLAKFLPDGRIEYIGRADNQVKIRGFRIELGEIEAALLRLEEVREAVVVARTDEQQNKQLTAFLIANDQAELPGKSRIYEILKKKLPVYMIPSLFVFLKRYPETLNRKIDRKPLTGLPVAELLEIYGEEEKALPLSSIATAAVVEPTPEWPDKPAEFQTFDAEDANEFLLLTIAYDLREMIAVILGMEPAAIDPKVPVEEYGLDSIRFASFSFRLKQTYGLELSPSDIMLYSTLDSLAGFLYEIQYEVMRSHYAEKLQSFSKYSSLASNRLSQPQAASSAERTDDLEPIAIIGLSGRFPGSRDLNEFWKHLVQNDDLISFMPSSRLELLDDGNHSMLRGAFLDQIDRFDAEFFSLSRNEAELLDPQQRILIETVWSMLEDAGYRPSQLSGTRTGIFVGMSGSDYVDLLKEHGLGEEACSASARMTAANRISAMMDWRGPSHTIDTGGSSSLAALHQAILALRSGQCELAVAGGAQLLLSPQRIAAWEKLGSNSIDGKHMAFAKDAQGSVPGEGIAALLLKPLNQAVADGDAIYALVRASGETHGGIQSGTANAKIQADLIAGVYRQGRIDPAAVSCIEAHSEGSTLGDSTEVNALIRAFRELYRKEERLLPQTPLTGVGSIKSNIGSLEAASGIAATVKMLLALKHGIIPASLHLNEINPYLDLQNSPFYLLQQNRHWARHLNANGEELPRTVGISSFGQGGTNVHIVLEEYREEQQAAQSNASGSALFVISAKNEDRLKQYAKKWAGFLESGQAGTQSLSDLAYTLQTGREPMEERLAIIASSHAELQAALQQFASSDEPLQHSNVFHGSQAVRNRDWKEAEVNAANEAAAAGDLYRIAALWTTGLDVDWTRLHDRVLRKVSLPTYPFAKEHYWLPMLARKPMTASSKAAILGVSEELRKDEFSPYWSNMRLGKAAPIGKIDLGMAYLRLAVKHDRKMLHFTLRTPTCNKMEVVIVGRGKPLLMIPGYGLTAPQFLYQIEEWSDRYQMIIVHSPGFGLSEGSGDLSFPGIVQAYIEVLNELGFERPVHVMGASWGGMVGQWLAKLHPERIASLTLIGSPIFSADEPNDDLSRKDRLKMDFERIQAADSYELLIQSEFPNPWGTNYAEIFEGEGFSTREILAEIERPTFVVTGSEDMVVDPAEARRLHAMIPNSEFFEVPGAGHAPNVTHSELFNEQASQFIDRHESRISAKGKKAHSAGLLRRWFG